MSDLDGGTIAYQRRDVAGARCAVVALDRPRHANALGRELVRELGEALDRAQAESADLLVLEGRGATFCAGVDVAEAVQDTEAELLDRFLRIEAVLQRVAGMPCVTVAVVHGWAVGAGADLMVACDYRIAAGESHIRFPGWGFGLALGTRRLAARIGPAAALDTLLGGRAIGADAAVRAGLLTHACDSADDAAAVVGRIAADCARVAPAARRRLLRLTRPAWSSADAAELADSILADGVREGFAQHAREQREARRRRRSVEKA
jgi:enoyl-CoA hydratase/carnithine racemase